MMNAKLAKRGDRVNARAKRREKRRKGKGR